MELTDDEVKDCINVLELAQVELGFMPPAYARRYGLQHSDRDRLKELSEKLVRYMDARGEARRSTSDEV